ncbi:hypothetical protein [Clostridium scatologenes]|jgi:hypothetical protein|uniref:Uncharacterized protein n=1 Tax=Clostridium scatologenes TaxID=1548 RepID=A0A0E3MA11_CLOSL|nr:hypothetical protein [Clostridium scatologenes]AKA70178.1 hypothetical protein CSCA_3053 [Clostridium scatologenes]
MNEEMKKKYNELKKKNEINIIRKEWESNTLLQECIENTGGKILDYDEGQKIVINIQEKFLFTVNGRMDWSNVNTKKSIKKLSDINDLVDTSVLFYVMWDEEKLPCLECQLKDIITFIDDVTSVSFDTWLVSSDYNIIIEFYHEGEITVGFLS